MLAFLLNSLARAKTLGARLASVAKLDNANSAVSDVAPANAALSDAVWTPARAGNLSGGLSGIASQASCVTAFNRAATAFTNLNGNISSIVASMLGGKVQTGYVGLLNNVTKLGSVEDLCWANVTLTVPVNDASKCLVLVDGWAFVWDVVSDPNAPLAATSIVASLINNSMLQVGLYIQHDAKWGSPSSYNTQIRWTLIEFD